ncbi:MAG: SDR family oxidoreductase [Lentisphaeria bacterium]|nr:SDR family oxidoreductase [Lentisphaeria bacterium]
MDQRELCGQTAWVTGSSRGIGRAIAEALAAAGAQVALHGAHRDYARLTGEGGTIDETAGDMATRTGSEVFPVVGDLTCETEVRRLAGDIRARWGRIDLLVCCAGGGESASGIADGRGGHVDRNDCLNVDLTDFRTILDRNLLTAVLCCREVAPEMIGRRAGRIVTIGSIAGCLGWPGGGGAAYSTAKAALHEYTRCLAEQLRPHNIPVNCVVPGHINTAKTKAAYGGDRCKSAAEAGHSRLQHVGLPEDIATLVRFLCGPGGDYISGQLLRVDGGCQTFPC